MNTDMLRAVQGRYLVTKDSGDVGGFAEKVSATRAAGATLVVVGRPTQKAGLSYEETVCLLCQRFGFSRQTRIFVIGIGLGRPDTMTVQARNAIESAKCLIGAGRMLNAVSHPGQMCYEAIALEKIGEWMETHPELERIAVLMSGDTGFFSGTKKLLPLLKHCNVEVLPGISSLSFGDLTELPTTMPVVGVFRRLFIFQIHQSFRAESPFSRLPHRISQRRKSSHCDKGGMKFEQR